jgi:hypothetical protein
VIVSPRASKSLVAFNNVRSAKLVNEILTKISQSIFLSRRKCGNLGRRQKNLRSKVEMTRKKGYYF